MPREIRIHGVSGTPPSQMLNRDGRGDPERVASYVDRLTGFYRDPSAPGVEAYSWGALTSGGGMALEWVKRVGWMALLPFAITNVVYWSRPGIEVDDDARRVSAVAVRWAGLLMTMIFVATVCLVSMDLFAWQCFRSGALVCSLPGWASFTDVLAEPALNSPSRRLLLTALVPILALGLLMWLSRQTRRHYEAVPDPEPGAGPGQIQGLAGRDHILRRRKMWQGQDRLRRQQRLHLVAGASVVILYAALPIVQAAGTPDTEWQRTGLMLLVLAVALALVALVSCLAAAAWSVRDGNEFFGPAPEASTRRADTCSYVALASAGLAGVLVAASNGWLLDGLPVEEGRNLFGNNLFIGAIILPLIAIVAFLTFASRSAKAAWLAGAGAIGTILIGLLLARSTGSEADAIVGTALAAAVIALVLWGGRLLQRDLRPGRSNEHAWGGAAPAVLLGAATWVALTFTVVAAVGSADVLNGDQPVTTIQASYEQITSAAAPALALQDQPEWQLSSKGGVVVRDAVVRQDDGLVVVSGTIVVAELYADDAGGTASALPGLTATSATISTGQDSITLENSCIETCASVVSRAVVGLREGETLRVDGEATFDVAQPPQETLVIPSVLLWVSTLLPVWAIAVAGVVIAVRLRFPRRAGAAIAEQVVDDGVAESDRERCTGARVSAAFTHRGERLVGFISIVTVAVALVAAAGAINGEPPWSRFEWLRIVGNVGLYAAIAIGAGLLLAASKVRSSPDARRQAGVMWDIATFWPRVGHPLGPPCYGERVVPEITRRVRETLADPGVVILSGHSQGSVIAAAVASRLSDEQLARVRLVTYGSQLRAWFGRLFPGALGPDALGTAPVDGAWGFDTAAPDAPTAAGALPPAPQGSLRGRVAWVNLYRRADPIGFRVFSDDGGAGDIPVGELDDRSDLSTHSGYQFTPEYAEVVEGWSGAVEPGARRAGESGRRGRRASRRLRSASSPHE